MKNFNFKTILCSTAFLVMLVTLFSCNKDNNEEAPIPQNIITFNGTTYTTTGAYAESSILQLDNIELAFYTEGLSYDIIQNGSSTSLKGSSILMKFSSATLEGTHQIEIGKASFVIDGDFSSEQDVKSKEVKSNGQGTVTITKNGDGYSVQYNIPYANGKLVGTYAGSIEKIKLMQPSPVEPMQPSPIEPSNSEFGGTIGFWDFSANGNNSITGESGDWVIDGISYDGQGLIFDGSVDNNKATKSRVQLFNPAASTSNTGLHQRRYFSGAIRFKVEKDSGTPLSFPILSFGLNPRFLDLEIINGKVQMTTNNSNTVKSTDIDVSEKVWNVLYFRYEGFSTPNDNKFYIQLNDSKEIVINLVDFKISEFANDNDNINLGFSSRSFVFKGNVDWVILARGRMKPENAQYLVNDLQN